MNNQKGFTLIEVLIAVTLFGIGFAVLIEGFSIITNTVEQNRDYSFVGSWAEGKLVEYINGGDLSNYGTFVYNGKDFNWTLARNPQGDDITEIELKVEWQGKSGRKSYTISRLVLTGGEDE